MKSSGRDRVIAALGAARMDPYLVATDGNKKRALALYRWSVELAASVQEVLGLTEVILRNAVDEQLQEWNNNEKGFATSWLLEDPVSPLRSLTQGKRVEALRRAEKAAQRRPPTHPRYGQGVTHDDALAHTMFGMWKDVLPNHDVNADPTNTRNVGRRLLWEEAMIKAFPFAEDDSGERTYWRVAHLHELRNRVSHMDSLLNVDVLDKVNDAYELVSSIDTTLSAWLSGTSTVSAVYKRKPQ